MQSKNPDAGGTGSSVSEKASPSLDRGPQFSRKARRQCGDGNNAGISICKSALSSRPYRRTLTKCWVLKWEGDSDLRAMIADAKRFVLYNRRIIEEASLQNYCSAILFAPTKSIIRKTFFERLPQWLCQIPIIQESWSQELLSLEGHTAEVRGALFSPHGELLASYSDDSTVRLWDVKTGAARGILDGHTDVVCTAAFSPDGQLLASGSYDSTVTLWDVKAGATYLILEGHKNWVHAVAFSPDSQLLASVSNDKTVRLWDMRTGVPFAIFEGHTRWVTAVAFSPDGQHLASTSSDRTVRVWDVRMSAASGILEGHTY